MSPVQHPHQSVQARKAAQVGIGWRHPHYHTVLQERPGVDFLEVHSENFFGAGGAARATLLQAREHYPVSLHGVGLSLGSACGLDDWHLDQLARLVHEVQPDWVSDHASFARGTFNTSTPPVHALDLLPVPFQHQALDVMCANVQRVQERLRRPIAVENLSAYLEWNGPQMSEPEFLNHLASRTGCRLLVDVNNIYVNAVNAARRAGADDVQAWALQSCSDWLASIHPEPVSELHLAGHSDGGDIVIDDHGSRVCAPVWDLYAQARRRFDRAVTLIEWDTAIPELDVLLGEAAHARAIAGAPQECVT